MNKPNEVQLRDSNRFLEKIENPGYEMVVPENHKENVVAEAVDLLAEKLAVIMQESTGKNIESNEKLISSISELLKKEIKFPEPQKPVSYTINVTRRDSDGRISEMTATPESVK